MRTRPVPWFGHLHHAAAPLPDLLGDDADEVLGAVDHQLLHRLVELAVDAAGDHLGLADRELVALAPHHLDQDRELQLAAPGDLEGVGGVARLDPDRDVGQHFALEPLLELAAGDVGALAPRHRRGVDREDHADGRLVDPDRRQRDRPLEVREGLADAELVEAGDRHDVARPRALDLRALEAVVAVEHGDLGLDHRAVVLDARHLLPAPDLAVEDAPDREPADVVVVVEAGDQQLQRHRRVVGRRRHAGDDLLEQRLEGRVRAVGGEPADPLAGVAVEHREVELLLVASRSMNRS